MGISTGIQVGAHQESPGEADPPPHIALWDVVGSLVLAVALAVSHPVLDLLSRNLAFFTAHQTAPLDVLGLALLLTIVIPLLAAVPVLILMWFSPRIGVVAYGLILGLFVAAASLPLVERIIDTPWLVAALALGIGGLVASACLRHRALQTLLRWGAVAPVTVLALFVFASPASGLVAPSANTAEAAGIGNAVPVVILVLDELPIQTLMDREGNIDSTRFPGFASLLQDFTWFRNTATMHDKTHEVLPVILSGGPYQPDIGLSATGYPNNLFSLLGPLYDAWAHEPTTALCGPEVCREQNRPGTIERWNLLLRDTSIVAAHVALPLGAAQWLPPLEGTWTGFGLGDADNASKTGTEAAVYDEFFDSLRSVGRHPLRFLHTIDPHFPWNALPEGLRYAGEVATNGKGHWDDDQWVVDLAHQSHILQTGYVDSQLVRFLDLIRGTAWYDDALVMVMADHGISFKAGVLIRGGIEDNIDDIAYVPLFVKTPGQREGRVDNRPAMLYDVMPTIVDVLEIESAWPMEGVSLLDEQPDSSRKRVFEGVVTNLELPSSPVLKEAIGRKVELFGSGNGWESVYNFGQYRELVGQMAETFTREPETADVEIVDQSLYDQVDPTTGIVPALIRASVSSASVASDTWLAVAVNGTVAGTARVHNWTSRSAEFSIIVPPTSFISGMNQIDLYRIVDTDQGPVLHHLDDR